MELQLEYFLLLAAALFCIGIYGLINSRNAVRVLMSIELLLNAVNLNLMAFSNYLDADAKGQVFSVFVITIAAAEAAVGLAIVLAIYRNRDTIDMEQFNLLKWWVATGDCLNRSECSFLPLKPLQLHSVGVLDKVSAGEVIGRYGLKHGEFESRPIAKISS